MPIQYADWVTDDLKRRHEQNGGREFLSSGSEGAAEAWDKLLQSPYMGKAWTSLVRYFSSTLDELELPRKTATELAYLTLGDVYIFRFVNSDLPEQLLTTKRERLEGKDAILKICSDLRRNLEKFNISPTLNDLYEQDELDAIYEKDRGHETDWWRLDLVGFLNGTIDAFDEYAGLLEYWQEYDHKQDYVGDLAAFKKYKKKRFGKDWDNQELVDRGIKAELMLKKPSKLDPASIGEVLPIMDSHMKLINDFVTPLNNNLAERLIKYIERCANHLPDIPELFPKPSVSSNRMNWFAQLIHFENMRRFKKPLWPVISGICAALFEDPGFDEERAKTQVKSIQRALKKSSLGD